MRRLVRSLTSWLVALGACAPPAAPAPSPSTPPDASPAPHAHERDAGESRSPLTLLAPPPRRAEASQKPPPPSASLGVAMLRALAEPRENVVVSPTSVRAALAMAALGARGETRDELADALHLERAPAAHIEAAQAERALWKSAAGGATLTAASRLWVDRSLPLTTGFSADCERAYGASAAPVDFLGGAEGARAAINRWVKSETRGTIRELLPAGSVSPSARLVLTSAVHFRGEWEVPFSRSATKDAPFHGTGGDVTLPQMQRTGTLRYAEADEVELVEIPYKGSELSLLVALPRPSVSLPAMLGELSAAELATWAASLRAEHVTLALPRFTFTWGRSLRHELEALGIRRAFTSDADFGAMTAHAAGLYVHDVVHKAQVQVDETGTEAAAATGAVLFPTSAPISPPRRVVVDRPFLFFVRHAASGHVLFAGRFSAPQRR